MRQTTDIICDLDNVKARIVELNMQKNDLIKELIEATAAKFEKEMNVKRGDTIKTRGGETLFYAGVAVSRYDNIIILCHPAKKDGTESKFVRYMVWSDF